MAQVDTAQMDRARIAMTATQTAETAMQPTRLLGFAPLAGVDALAVAIGAVTGPEVHVHHAPAGGAYPMVAALVQAEPDVALVSRGREALVAGLRTVQQRLEIACQAGPFLPMDPAAACCPGAAVARLLAAEWDALATALALHGARQQWDVVLKWAPEAVVARHRGEIAPAVALGPQALADTVAAVLRNERTQRESALIAALAPVVLEFAGGGAACTETSVTVTVLVGRGGEAAVETALDGMAAEHVEGASIDMRGPLPPVSFAAVRIATVEERAVSGAWVTLGLADRVDLSDLHRHWRMRAAAVHPDRQPLTANGPQPPAANGPQPPAADGPPPLAANVPPPPAANGAQPVAAEVSVAELTDAYRLLRGLLRPGAGADCQTLSELMDRAGPRLVMPAGGVDRAAPGDAAQVLVPELTA